MSSSTRWVGYVCSLAFSVGGGAGGCRAELSPESKYTSKIPSSQCYTGMPTYSTACFSFVPGRTITAWLLIYQFLENLEVLCDCSQVQSSKGLLSVPCCVHGFFGKHPSPHPESHNFKVDKPPFLQRQITSAVVTPRSKYYVWRRYDQLHFKVRGAKKHIKVLATTLITASCNLSTNAVRAHAIHAMQTHTNELCRHR